MQRIFQLNTWLTGTVLAGALGCGSDDPSAVEKRELSSELHAVTSLEPTSPDEELRPLDAIVGNASYVGLGESVHTSGGFYRAKFRLFKYLVENHGFRAFAFETPWPAAEVITRYVDTCEGDPRQATKQGLFGVFAAAETQGIFEWMCGWNKAHPDDKVRAFGFDVQQPEDDGPALRAFVTRVAGSEAASLLEGIASCASQFHEDGSPIQVTAQGHHDCLGSIGRISSWLEANAPAITAQTSGKELAYARIRVVGLRAWEVKTYHFTSRRQGRPLVTGGEPNEVLSFESRDEGMATVLRAIRDLEAPGKRVAVWAHNAHVSQSMNHAREARSMGTFLRTALGTDYVAIGLTAHDVSINWPSVGTGPLRSPSADSLEAQLRAFDRPYLLVDTKPSDDPRALLQPGETFAYGVNSGEKGVPSEQYGAIFYLQSSPAMTPLSW